MDWIHILLPFIRGILRDRTELAAENLALRQQLAALQHRSKRPRAHWIGLSKFFLVRSAPNQASRNAASPRMELLSGTPLGRGSRKMTSR